jgi:hypothetical protein
MNPLEHTGDSANLSWYAERHQDNQEYVYAEVLRSDLQRTSGGIIIHRSVPVYEIRVSRVTDTGRENAGSFTYEPRRKPNPLVLGNRTVTRLVREHLDPESGVRFEGGSTR